LFNFKLDITYLKIYYNIDNRIYNIKNIIIETKKIIIKVINLQLEKIKPLKIWQTRRNQNKPFPTCN